MLLNRGEAGITVCHIYFLFVFVCIGNSLPVWQKCENSTKLTTESVLCWFQQKWMFLLNVILNKWNINNGCHDNTVNTLQS